MNEHYEHEIIPKNRVSFFGECIHMFSNMNCYLLTEASMLLQWYKLP